MTTHVYFGRGEAWHLIERFDHFVDRWTNAMRRREFMPVRYAGSERYVNPLKIFMVSNCEVP
jgi:hypothetical protein